MFSSAFKSFNSNITANYEVSKQPTATAGVWTIFDAKKKSTNAQASIFVFKRESLEVRSDGFGARSSATSIRKVQDEVVERLKKEASSLARLRHPSVLQLVEPVEETRSGGLMFATEPVVASLGGILAQKDAAESSGNRSRSERNSQAFRTVELDELEVQKGLLQVAKGLEFLHDSAKLVHGNFNPDAVFVNAKSDWKISGLGFAGPADGAEGHQSIPQISLSEVLHHDQRIPRSVQLDMDYTSPDFVLDANVTFAADIFSLGLVLLACYRKPHTSPFETNGSQSAYKKICSTTSTVPNPSNNYLSANQLPRELASTLPRVLARRPASRMTATEFQQSEYFDNILVNTMRFLDALPAKTPAEKSQFMRGLGRVMPQFPPSVLGKKVLSALLDEMKDRDLLALILQNIFAIVKAIPNSKEAVSDKVLPQVKEVFLAKSKSEERDTSREAALLVILENIKLLADNCTAKQFKDDVLPIVQVAMESTTHSLTDAALQTVPVILPLIDFSTVKHELFPIVANVFAKTSSLSIKVRGLEALGVLCGVSSASMSRPDDLSGRMENEQHDKNISSLDKFTMQEKVVPLLKGIKTKEPAVMLAALKVFRQVGQAADAEFLATEVLPVLWTFALGPLLDLAQFQSFMQVIKAISGKIEKEQVRKLQELGTGRAVSESRSASSAAPVSNGFAGAGSTQATGNEDDFAKLVLGNKTATRNDPFAGALSDGERLTQNPPTFSWSSTNNPGVVSQPQRSFTPNMTALQPQAPSRSVTPDVSAASFPSLQPSTSGSTWNQPATRPLQSPSYGVAAVTSPALASSQQRSGLASPPILPPPPSNPTFSNTAWQQPNYNIAPPPSAPVSAQPQQRVPQQNPLSVLQPQPRGVPQAFQAQKSGLDKYQSLL
ncbi:Protein kinase domain-containing protein ppk32 [Cyphellophora attinorum]|uniref:Protein kinase domain-containing protein ppk32 n=1 Tax=Cyphellophora attinorum TaxID=1664694 RepID=A0A0N0NQN1_9EURO|nr:Protein kinase domain-containing protein ppk32 [Phialophora attinorum]KPI43899.1 Protein kinase domain-containing protein ppk32 [Phialophora attinorum]